MSDDAIIEAIGTYVAAHGYPPSVRDLAAAVGFMSSSTMYERLTALRTAGRLTFDPKITRSIVLTAAVMN